MPIPKDKFQKATKSLEEKILEYLKENNSQAFNIWEIIVACEELFPKDDVQALMLYFRYQKEYQEALNKLLQKNLIQEGRISGENYYGSI